MLSVEGVTYCLIKEIIIKRALLVNFFSLFFQFILVFSKLMDVL